MDRAKESVEKSIKISADDEEALAYIHIKISNLTEVYQTKIASLDEKISDIQKIISNLNSSASTSTQSNHEKVKNYIKLVEAYTTHVRALHQAYSDAVSSFYTRSDVDEKIKIVKSSFFDLEQKFEKTFKELNLTEIEKKLKDSHVLIDDKLKNIDTLIEDRVKSRFKGIYDFEEKIKTCEEIIDKNKNNIKETNDKMKSLFNNEMKKFNFDEKVKKLIQTEIVNLQKENLDKENTFRETVNNIIDARYKKYNEKLSEMLKDVRKFSEIIGDGFDNVDLKFQQINIILDALQRINEK